MKTVLLQNWLTFARRELPPITPERTPSPSLLGVHKFDPSVGMADWLFIPYSAITFTEYLRPLKNFHNPPSSPFLAIKANIRQNWPK